MRFVPIVLLCILAVSASSAGIVMSPYLQGLTEGSVYVMVETTTQDTVFVRYGKQTLYGSSAISSAIVKTTGGTFVHRVLLDRLSPNTTYHFSARQGRDSSADSHFTTCVPPGTPFRFAWMADCRTGSEVFDSVIIRLSATHPRFGLFGGDLSFSGAYSTWKSEFFRPPLLAFSAVVPWVNAPGNHEGWAANTMAFTHAPAGSANEDYFSFDCGDLHVLVLDSQGSLDPGSPQYLFADKDLAASGQRWKIVMFHKPAYCGGGHGEDEDMIDFTSAVLEKRGVAMVLAGHSHFYQHNLVNGIHHMVIGSAGAPLYDPSNEPYTLKSVKDYNWAICDVTPDVLLLQVFNDKGKPLDTVRLEK